MDLNTITEVRRPADAITDWDKGYAWLAGGTWLFSEPQIETHTLIDLESLKWPSLSATSGFASTYRGERRRCGRRLGFTGRLRVLERISWVAQSWLGSGETYFTGVAPLNLSGKRRTPT